MVSIQSEQGPLSLHILGLANSQLCCLLRIPSPATVTRGCAPSKGFSVSSRSFSSRRVSLHFNALWQHLALHNTLLFFRNRPQTSWGKYIRRQPAGARPKGLWRHPATYVCRNWVAFDSFQCQSLSDSFETLESASNDNPGRVHTMANYKKIFSTYNNRGRKLTLPKKYKWQTLSHRYIDYSDR
jgi:hypothetical protein